MSSKHWTVAEAKNKPLAALLLALVLLLYVSGCGLTTAANSNTPGNVSSLTITTSTLSPAVVQSTYQASMTASGGKQPYTWSIAAGSLPPGLHLTSSTGTISGMPSQSGTFNFSAQVQDSSSPLKTVTGPVAVTVSSTTSPLQITTSSLPAGKVGTTYQATLTASGGTQPYIWSAPSGSLPPGLTLNSSTGVLSGSPTQQGTFSFTIHAVDSTSQSATASVSIAIATSTTTPSALAISTTSLPSGQVSRPYSATLAATGGQTPYTWGMTSSSGPLPSGLTLSATTGTISGTPTTSASYTFTIQVSDSSSTQQLATQTYTVSTAGVTLDQYGGRQDIKCATVTPYFHLEKINNRWFFCDALGNALVSMSVGAVEINGNPTNDCQGINTYPIYAAKYGTSGSSVDSSNWGWQTLKRMTAWGFNSVGQDSVGSVLPWQISNNSVWPGGKQPIPVPYITEAKPAENGATNAFGYLTSPLKDEISGTNNNYTAWRPAAVYDVFDPALNAEWTQELQSTQPSNQEILNNSPYLLGVFTDDSDFFFGSGAGPDFPAGHTNANMAWITLLTTPVQTYSQATPQGNKTVLYTTTQNFTKTLATNPTTPCSISSPCSLRDYLWQKYQGSIANLNAAWGSNYSTFDSAGTPVTSEAIGTGNGSTTTFTHTLAHTAVSPFSVLISVGGKAQMGDCPWFHGGCITTTANTGTLNSTTASFVTQSTSTINYSTGSITLTFATAPALGVPITANYIQGGWMAGGTGLMDEDGSHTAWVGTNPWCLEGPDPNYPTYYSCTGTSGNNPVPNANPALAADLDNWVPQIAAKYFKTMHDDLKAVSKVPYLGLDTIGSWGAPAYSKFLEGAAPYLDGAFVQLLYSANSPAPATFQSAYQYTTQYLGDVPLLDFVTLVAEPDSSMSCHPVAPFENFPTQQARGQEYYNTVSYLLTTPGHNGTIPFVGFNWWSWQDFQNTNQGLVSIHDNAYDGIEAVTGTVPCDSFYTSTASCGGEPTNYGDLITPVRNANLYWILH